MKPKVCFFIILLISLSMISCEKKKKKETTSDTYVTEKRKYSIAIEKAKKETNLELFEYGWLELEEFSDPILTYEIQKNIGKKFLIDPKLLDAYIENGTHYALFGEKRDSYTSSFDMLVSAKDKTELENIISKSQDKKAYHFLIIRIDSIEPKRRSNKLIKATYLTSHSVLENDYDLYRPRSNLQIDNADLSTP